MGVLTALLTWPMQGLSDSIAAVWTVMGSEKPYTAKTTKLLCSSMHTQIAAALFLHPPSQTKLPLVCHMDKVTKRLCILFALRSCGGKVSILFLFVVIFPISNHPSNGVMNSSASFIILCVS